MTDEKLRLKQYAGRIYTPEPTACQHDLFLPEDTIIIDADGLGATCTVCGKHRRATAGAALSVFSVPAP
jgi:hypothetical protein